MSKNVDLYMWSHAVSVQGANLGYLHAYICFWLLKIQVLGGRLLPDTYNASLQYLFTGLPVLSGNLAVPRKIISNWMGVF